MDKRKITIISLVLVILLLLAGIIYFYYFYKFPGTVMPAPAKVVAPVAETNNLGGNQAATSTAVVKQAEIPAAPAAVPPTSDEVLKGTLAKIASSFAERLGSYSNQENYANILNLKVSMTSSMQKWADSYVASARKANPYSGVYEGVTTKAVSSEIKSFDSANGTAQIIIKTQKVKSTAAVDANIAYNEDLLVSFVKENGDWKVDNAKWENKR